MHAQHKHVVLYHDCVISLYNYHDICTIDTIAQA